MHSPLGQGTSWSLHVSERHRRTWSMSQLDLNQGVSQGHWCLCCFSILLLWHLSPQCKCIETLVYEIRIIGDGGPEEINISKFSFSAFYPCMGRAKWISCPQCIWWIIIGESSLTHLFYSSVLDWYYSLIYCQCLSLIIGSSANHYENVILDFFWIQRWSTVCLPPSGCAILSSISIILTMDFV